MVKNNYVKGYTTRKPNNSRPHRKKVVVLGTVILVALAAWLLWREWQQRVQPGLVPLARNKIIRPIPLPPPGGGNDSEYIRFSSKNTPAPAPERRLTMEADLPSPSKETKSSARQETGGDTPQALSLTDVQKETDSTPESPHVEPGNKSEETYTSKDSTSKVSQEEFVIQVGAFRRLAAAENLQKGLKDKGYNAYLDGRNLPKLGLVHRVRIRGYTSSAAAKAAMGRLQKEEGLNSFVLNPEPNSTTASEK